MRFETRIFKHKSFLLIIPEYASEMAQLDCLGNAVYAPRKISAELCTDDSFTNYIRIEMSNKRVESNNRNSRANRKR